MSGMTKPSESSNLEHANFVCCFGLKQWGLFCWIKLSRRWICLWFFLLCIFWGRSLHFSYSASSLLQLDWCEVCLPPFHFLKAQQLFQHRWEKVLSLRWSVFLFDFLFGIRASTHWSLANRFQVTLNLINWTIILVEKRANNLICHVRILKCALQFHTSLPV